MKKVAAIFFTGLVSAAGTSAFAGTGSLQMTHPPHADSAKSAQNLPDTAGAQKAVAGSIGPLGTVGPETQMTVARRSPSLHR